MRILIIIGLILGIFYKLSDFLKNTDNPDPVISNSIVINNTNKDKINDEDKTILLKNDTYKEEKEYLVDASNKISPFSIDKNSIDIAVNSIISTERNLNKILDYNNDFDKVDTEYALIKHIENLTFLSDKLDYLARNASNINYNIVRNEVEKLETYKHTLHTIRDR